MEIRLVVIAARDHAALHTQVILFNRRGKKREGMAAAIFALTKLSRVARTVLYITSRPKSPKMCARDPSRASLSLPLSLSLSLSVFLSFFFFLNIL